MTSPPRWWWTPATTYIVIAGVLRLVWPEAFQMIVGVISLTFFWASWKWNPAFAIALVGKTIFPIRNTVEVEVKTKGNARLGGSPKVQVQHEEPELDEDAMLSPEEMERFSVAKRRWERTRSIEEMENRGEIPF